MMFDGVYGNQIANGNLRPETNTSPTGNNMHNVRTEAYLGAWSESNQDARYPRLNRTAGQTKDFTDRILKNAETTCAFRPSRSATSSTSSARASSRTSA